MFDQTSDYVWPLLKALYSLHVCSCYFHTHTFNVMMMYRQRRMVAPYDISAYCGMVYSNEVNDIL